MTACHNYSSCNDASLHECVGDSGFVVEGTKQTYSACILEKPI